jgi:membrane protease YdiL (CAAX protease family)
VDPRRVLILALGTQAFLAVLGIVAAHALGLTIRWGDPMRDVPIGIAAAAGLAIANYALLILAPGGWLVDGVRTVYRHVLVPLFARLDRASIAVIAVSAGIGEELFFRGVVQAALGWIAGSVVFGVAHVGGRQMIAFGLWATAMGLALGGLALSTGGLLAPAIAHGVYDALALEYIRRTSASTVDGFHRE